jgi:hypothetical protein
MWLGHFALTRGLFLGLHNSVLLYLTNVSHLTHGEDFIRRGVDNAPTASELTQEPERHEGKRVIKHPPIPQFQNHNWKTVATRTTRMSCIKASSSGSPSLTSAISVIADAAPGFNPQTAVVPGSTPAQPGYPPSHDAAHCNRGQHASSEKRANECQSLRR